MAELFHVPIRFGGASSGPRVLWLALLVSLLPPLLPVASAQTAAVDPQVNATAPLPVGPAVGLTDVINRVLSRDPQVRAANAQRAAAEQRLKQAQSRYWPVLGLAVVGGRSQEKDINLSVDRRTERADLTLRWNLYNGGNDAAEVSATEREAAATVEDLLRAREEVAERLVDAALDLQRMDRQLPASAERLAGVQALVRQVRRQAELGRIAEVDLQQAITSLVDARLLHDQLLAEREGIRMRLVSLAGEELQRLHPFELNGIPLTLAGAVPPGAPEGVHAGVRSARLRALAARQRVRPMASLLAPRVDVDLSRRVADHTSPPLSTDQHHSWQVGVRWEMPLGGESLARIEEGYNRAEAAEQEAQRVELAARAELAALGPRISSGERAVTLLQRQIDQSTQLIRAGELQFEAGRRSVQQLIALRDQRFSAEQRLAEQLMRLNQARLRQLSLAGALLPGLNWLPRMPDPLPRPVERNETPPMGNGDDNGE